MCRPVGRRDVEGLWLSSYDGGLACAPPQLNGVTYGGTCSPDSRNHNKTKFVIKCLIKENA